jgi:CRP-like cAMP-binding protein
VAHKIITNHSILKFEKNSNDHTVHNSILLGLPKRECSAVMSKLEFERLPAHSVLAEAGEEIEFVYFVNDGLASVLNVLISGKSVEVGLCGFEGFVGLPLIAGFESSPSQIIMQVAGSAFKLAAKDFVAALRSCPTLAKSLGQFAQEMGLQSAQIAACNRLHAVDKRLARWLLMSQDRIGGVLVPLTQEFLSHMLATRRASVTGAAGVLQKAGLITYSRGLVKVENRSKLEAATCECYAAMKRQAKKWHSENGAR